MSLFLCRSPGCDAYPGNVFYVHSRFLEHVAKMHCNMGGGFLTAITAVATRSQGCGCGRSRGRCVQARGDVEAPFPIPLPPLPPLPEEQESKVVAAAAKVMAAATEVVAAGDKIGAASSKRVVAASELVAAAFKLMAAAAQSFLLRQRLRPWRPKSWSLWPGRGWGCNGQGRGCAGGRVGRGIDRCS